MDHIRMWGIEPSSVIPRKTEYKNYLQFLKLSSSASKIVY